MALTQPFKLLLVGILLACVRSVSSLGATDTITWGGDVGRSGYQTNHNMDPAIIGGGSFGQIFKAALPGNFNSIGPEQIYSQTLVYTGTDGVQYLYVATTQNNIYKLDAKTGSIVAKRNLWVPFLTADLNGCVDINPTVGVTATGVIDPASGIWYFTAKTYSSQFQNGQFSPKAPPGRLNGRYYFHAINTADLTDAFAPTSLEGTIFRNNPNRMFISGNQHQRPALLMVGNYIYTGYASHCVQYNFTGAIIGFNKNTGAIVESFATEGGPEANTVPGGGVWMSGGGLAYDGHGSMYFGTGNGYASQLPATGQSVPGRNPPTALEEAAVNAKINDDGTISIIDFFMPWEKTQLDGADKDLGTSPLEILPSDVFSCPNQQRIGVITGKSGKTYWLNLDNLGGYQNGPNKLDAVIQVFQNENSVYAGAGVMPLGGGYIYINVIQYPTHVFKFSCNAAGNAAFTKVADTNEKNAYILGVGHGTTTSLNGQEGTGLVWVSDVEGTNLRVYNAIPPSPGQNLTMIYGANIPGVTKFTRPVFGNGRVYIGTTLGYLYGFGSPVTLPLNCSSPYTFANTPIGNVSTPLNVTCVANIQTTVNSIALTGNPNFNISGLPNTPLALAAGKTMTFQAVFAPNSIGLLSSDVVVNTTNGVTGYSTSTPITLRGTSNSVKPLLAISPNTVSFNTIVGQGAADQSAIFANNGDTQLTFVNISYSTQSETGPWIAPNSTSNGTTQIGPFIFSNLPSSIAPNTVAPITISYSPTQVGNDAVFLKAFSNGGNSLLDVLGVAGSQPVALFEFQTPDGSGWVPYVPGQNFTFGNVTENTTRNLKFRITNNGTVNAAPLSLTVSKPPYGVPGIVGAANDRDLTEGTTIPAGTNQTATLYCSPPKIQANTPGFSQVVQWTVNTNDPNSGKHVFQFACNAVSEQLGPVYPNNGTARYTYVGCARDNNPGRQLATQLYADGTNNTNDKCMNACYAQGYTFAGTQYQSQCWCGNTIPVLFDAENNCNYQCTGDTRQTCGGNGFYNNQTEISLFADISKFNGNTTSAPLHMVQSVGNYNYLGCFAESNGKALTTNSFTANNMTVEYCQTLCGSSPYFGLEYASQCYCGSSIMNGATVTADSQCSMNCPGSNSEYCGSGNRMQVYQLGTSTPTTSSTSTAATSTSTLASTISVGTTSVITTGATTSTISSATLATSTISSATPTSTVPASPATVGKFVYQGCYSEVPGRALQSSSFTNTTSMTNGACAAFCSGYTYFATEYSQECYCGNTLVSGSAPATDGRCSMLCTGDSLQICGGANGLSLYMLNATGVTTTSASTLASATPTPTPSVLASAGNYASFGCWSETNRALSNLYANDSMTIQMCAAQAQSQGAIYFGVEYARECWYGKTFDPKSQPIPQSNCNKLCPGNSLNWCGGGNALQMYNLTQTTSTAVTSTSTSLSSTTSSSTTATSASSSQAATSTVISTSSPASTSSSAAAPSTTSTVAASTTATDISTSSTSLPVPVSTTITTAFVSATTANSTVAVTQTVTTTMTTVAVPTQSALSCPGSNNSTWWAPSGAQFVVECDTDHQGGDLKMVYVNSYEGCITACDSQPGCVDVSLSGNACYMKKSLGAKLAASGLRGAKLVIPQGQTSTTILPTN